MSEPTNPPAADLATILEDPTRWQTGTVTFTDWQRIPWQARIVAGVIGQVTVVASDEALGFTMRGGDHANWLALVTGPSGIVHVVPGCKILSITFGTNIQSAEYAEVP